MNQLYKFVIVGGGTAGWMAAAALVKALPRQRFSITLVESDNIPTIGVGEATIPPIETFNKLIGITASDLIKSSNATFKLGIEFINWKNLGHSYYHPFGAFGTDIQNLPFYQYWHKAKQIDNHFELKDYSLNSQMAISSTFLPPQNIENSPLSKIQYAYHFDAALYAKLLREIAEQHGVTRIESDVIQVKQNQTTGHIDSLVLSNDQLVDGDFFIDCTGFRGLLIEETLKTGYESWEQYLLCDSAKAVASAPLASIPSHTKAIAHGFGWQWKIPLQHRLGNGYVYASNFIPDDSAEQNLLYNLESEPTGDVRQLRFTPGKRKKCWNKNCLALGLASGFLEPLESTSIHMVQSAISKFLGLFPNLNNYEAAQNRFNQLVDKQTLAIRDFIILHYKATNREDTEFWRYCKNMEIPDSLQEKLELFKAGGHLSRDEHDLFSENSWLAVLEGQGITPDNYSPLADHLSEETLISTLANIRSVIKKCAQKAPPHKNFLSQQLK